MVECAAMAASAERKRRIDLPSRKEKDVVPGMRRMSPGSAVVIDDEEDDDEEEEDDEEDDASSEPQLDD